MVSFRRLRLLAACAVAGVVCLACGGGPPSDPAVVVGAVDPTPEPSQTPEPPVTAVPGPIDARLRAADGSGPLGAVSFAGAVDVPAHLQFFLVIGGDARPGEDPARSRADSIHVAAVDPRTRRGTVLGLPRDSYVNVPGHGHRKITEALSLGGPQLLARTVRDLTGLPLSYYALTGFDGIVRIVDALGGLDVYVPERMNDRASGARFERGWHRMNGHEVLAFTRNRHLSGGDFTRSENHGRVIVHALERMRATVSDEAGVRAWVDILFRHARLDMGPAEAVRLGKFARTIGPADLVNVVAPGTSRSAGGASVVVLSEEAYRLFRDVGADAVADGNERPVPPPPTASPTPAPTARPTPKPTPTPAPTPTPRPGSSPTPSPTPTPKGVLPVG